MNRSQTYMRLEFDVGMDENLSFSLSLSTMSLFQLLDVDCEMVWYSLSRMNISSIILRIETATPKLVFNTHSILLVLGTPIEAT